jgi:hypothetical protein
VDAARRPSHWPLGDVDWLGSIVNVSGSASATARGITSFIEACRRLAVAATAEEEQEAGEEQEGDEDEGAMEARHRAYILGTLAKALPELQRYLGDRRN